MRGVKPICRLPEYESLAVIIGLFVAIMFPPLLRAQTSFQLTGHYGFIIPHREEIQNLIQGHSWGLNADYELNYKREKFWHRAWSGPRQTWTATYLNTGNPLQLGSHLSILHQLFLPLQKLDSQRRIHQTLALGVGLGYTTKIWNQESNYQAPALSSHLNTALALQYGIEFTRNERSRFSAGLRLAHFSNGSLRTPNLGTNNFSFFVSKRIGALDARKSIKRDSLLTAEICRYKFTAGYLFGIKEILPPGERKYFVSIASLGIDRRMNARYSLCFGLDGMRNSSLPELMKEKLGRSNSVNDLMQLGATFGCSMHFNRFELRFQQGAYIIDGYKQDGLLYQRVGLRFYVSEKWWLGLMLKTHFAKADYGEYGMGYAISWRKVKFNL